MDKYRTEKIVLELTRDIFDEQDDLLACTDPNHTEEILERIRELEVLRDMYLYELLKREGFIR